MAAGAFTVVYSHKDADWKLNNVGYPPFENRSGEIAIVAVKTAPWTLRLSITGAAATPIEVECTIPFSTSLKLVLGASWDDAGSGYVMIDAMLVKTF